MSYIQLPDGIPGFTKTVISLWFRVPQSSIDNAYEEAKKSSEPDADRPLKGIIPLVVMGPRGKEATPTKQSNEQVLKYTVTGYQRQGLGTTFSWNIKPIQEPPCPVQSMRVEGHYGINLEASIEPAGPDYIYTTALTFSKEGSQKPTDATFIGVDCTAKPPNLFVNFETNKKGSYKNAMSVVTVTPGVIHNDPPQTGVAFEQGIIEKDWCSQPFGLYISPIPGSIRTISDGRTPVPWPEDHYTEEASIDTTDVSDEFFDNTEAIYADTSAEIVGNRWHHLLVSADLKTIKSHGSVSGAGENESEASFVDSTSFIFVAVDDVNYTKENLSSNWPDKSNSPNAVATRGALNIAGARTVEGGSVMEYMLDSPSVPSSGKPIGLPATAEFTDNIYHVEMAEFQMWTGKVIDTGKESNRRAFIAVKKDAKGNQDPDGLKPAPLAAAGKLLGKPIVSMHGSSKWIKGKNIGGGGQFKPTGKIIRYRPDPSLGGDQGPPQ